MMPETKQFVASSVIVQRTGARSAWRNLSRPQQSRIIGLAGCASLVTLVFVQPLVELLGLALENELHSYIPIVPLISGYLLYAQPKTAVTYRSSIGATIVLVTVGLATLAVAIRLQDNLSVNDHLALMMLAYVSFIEAVGFLFLGSTWMGAAAFPVAFLIFMVPLPDGAVAWLERASMAGSADAAALFFKLTGTPLFREGMVLTLPGIVLEVAEECSGIRSSLVLFITSMLASHLFLRSSWRRVVLVAFVIPLGIVRNGFRILVIGLLCVHVGPHMIDSFIHHRGGPIFFVLSLVPLLLFLLWLRRQDKQVHVHE
jgi:exosortase C (VPDSG-CTERM-specific)